jgi:hypothetical protein
VLPEDDIRYVETCRRCESFNVNDFKTHFKLIHDIIIAFVVCDTK